MSLEVLNFRLDEVFQLVDGISFQLVRLYGELLGPLVNNVSVVGGSSAVPCKDLAKESVDAVC